MEIAEHIINILNTKTTVVLSWGFHNPTVIENGLKFNVHGFIFTGEINVFYNRITETFTVCLFKLDGTFHSETNEVHPNNLVDIIDNLVEKGCSDEEYKIKVHKHYSTENIQHL